MGFLFSKESSPPPRKPIKYFIIGGDKKFINILFPKIIDCNKKRYIKEIEFGLDLESEEEVVTLKDTIQWDATIYPNITDANLEETFIDLSKIFNVNLEDGDNENTDLKDEKNGTSNLNKNKSIEEIKNVLMIFGENNFKYFIDNPFLKYIPKLYLPQVAIITENDLNIPNDIIEDQRYITIIKEKFSNKKELIKKILSYMWEKECYYNERGNAICDYSPTEIDKGISTNTYLNIIVTGITRSGKSTLTNLLSDKLVSLESDLLESVTSNIREYCIYHKNKENYKYGIKIYDTPGLTIKNENGKITENTIDIVKETITKKIKECNDSRNDIHMIYFVLNKYSNLESYVDFFQFLIETNNERVLNGKKKIPVVFIINYSNGKNNSLFKFLKDHNFTELYEKFNKKEQNNKKKFSFLEKLNQNDKKEDLNDNIISVNLLSGLNSKSFGISSIFEATLLLIKKNNPFTIDNFKVLSSIKEELDIINKKKTLNDVDLNNLELLKNSCQKIYNKISKENSLLESCKNIIFVLEKAKKEANKCYFWDSFSVRYSYYKFDREECFLKTKKALEHIQYCYKLFTNEITFEEIKDKNSEVLGFYICDPNHPKRDSLKIENINDSNKNAIMIYSNETKSNYRAFFDFLFGRTGISSIKKCIDYFDEYVKKQLCIDYVITEKMLYERIFNQLEVFSKKEDWDSFHINYI